LKTTSQTKVTQEGQTIVVEPANPEIVYVPQYDPWVVYGAPVVAWPGWYGYPGLFVAGPGIAFDVGFSGGFGWGWDHWGCDWHRRTVVFNHNVFVSRGRTFVNRNAFNRERLGSGRPGGFHGGEFHGDGSRGGGLHDPSGFSSGVRGGTPAVHASPGRGFQAPRGQTSASWGAFSGFDHGGVTRGDSARGQSSFGGGVRGGGDFHGGGGAPRLEGAVGGGHGGGEDGQLRVVTGHMEEELMPTRRTMVEAFPGRALTRLVASSAVSVLLLAGGARWSRAEESETQTFSSTGEACQALFHAVRDDDAQALAAILGPELTSSGAESEDKLERQRFDAKYCEMHRLVRGADGTTELYIGAENWPFPVPLVAESGRWRFDTAAGQREILLRRVGHDEATAVRVCEALGRTTPQHAAVATSDDPITRYAERLRAHTDAGQSAEEPFHGYFFRDVTTRPGTSAARIGRAHAGRKQTHRLAFVAYPADYRSSGVMTFVVADDGALYEKDLGPDTATVAPDLNERPASGWHAVETEPATPEVGRAGG
jgi:hypothetical protein